MFFMSEALRRGDDGEELPLGDRLVYRPDRPTGLALMNIEDGKRPEADFRVRDARVYRILREIGDILRRSLKRQTNAA
jgi:hypothetical protein